MNAVAEILIAESVLRETAKTRPPGYEQAIRSAGRLENGVIHIAPADFVRVLTDFGIIAEPSPLLLARDFATESAKWIAAGFPLVDAETFATRERACKGADICGLWQPGGYMGVGKCPLCGCTKLKLHLATTTCPRGIW